MGLELREHVDRVGWAREAKRLKKFETSRENQKRLRKTLKASMRAQAITSKGTSVCENTKPRIEQ